jgi:hypothetical protein
MPMFPMLQSLHFRRQSQLGVSVKDGNRIGAQDARYLAMIAMYTQHSLQYTKLASCEEQGPSSWAVVLLSKI